MSKTWEYCRYCDHPITVRKDGKLRRHGDCPGGGTTNTREEEERS